MGLIAVKAIKPAAGEQQMFESEYALTVIPIAVDNGGVKYFVSYNTTAVTAMNIGIQAGVGGYFHSEQTTTTVPGGWMGVGGVDQYLGNTDPTAGVISGFTIGYEP